MYGYLKYTLSILPTCAALVYDMHIGVRTISPFTPSQTSSIS